jgi:chromosome segregation protein
VLAEADEARAEAQAREAEARAARSEAEGEFGALRAEVAALAKLVERDTAEGGQVLDLIRVEPGYEQALGAALADDLRAPAVGPMAARAGPTLPPIRAASPARGGASAGRAVVEVPPVLARRIAQIGLVDGRGRPTAAGRAEARAAACQPRWRALALGRVPRGGRGCAVRLGAAAAAAEPAAGAAQDLAEADRRRRGCRRRMIA